MTDGEINYAVKSGAMQHRQNTRDAIANRTEFKTGGGLRGGPTEGTTGALWGEAQRAYFEDAGWIIYVVYSYKTPIAWATQDYDTGIQWTVVTDSFSPTTKTHQGVVRSALNAAGREYREVGE